MKVRTLPSAFSASLYGAPVNLQADADATMALAGILVPADFTLPAIKFQASLDSGSNWAPVIKADGSDYELTCTGSTLEFITISPSDLSGIPMIRPVAASTITTGDLQLVCRLV